VHERVEREMLRLLARSSDVYAEVAPRLSDEHFQSSQHRKLFETLRKADGDVRAIVATADAGDDRTAAAMPALALEPLDGPPTLAYALDVWTRLQELALKQQSASLRQRLQKMNPTSDDGYDALFQELIAADGELRRLRERHGDLV
jgi:DNA-binding NtrC family response regulator